MADEKHTGYEVQNPNTALDAALEAARLSTVNPADERMKRRRSIPPERFGSPLNNIGGEW